MIQHKASDLSEFCLTLEKEFERSSVKRALYKVDFYLSEIFYQFVRHLFPHNPNEVFMWRILLVDFNFD